MEQFNHNILNEILDPVWDAYLMEYASNNIELLFCKRFVEYFDLQVMQYISKTCYNRNECGFCDEHLCFLVSSKFEKTLSPYVQSIIFEIALHDKQTKQQVYDYCRTADIKGMACLFDKNLKCDCYYSKLHVLLKFGNLIKIQKLTIEDIDNCDYDGRYFKNFRKNLFKLIPSLTEIELYDDGYVMSIKKK